MNTILEQQLKLKYNKVKVSGDWFYIPCPTCAPHNKNKMKRYVPANGYNSGCFICGIKQDVATLVDGYYIPSNLVIEEKEEVREINQLSLVLPYNHAIPVNQLAEDHPAIQFLYKDELRDLDTYANEYKIVFVPFEGGRNFHNGRTYITSAERLIFPVYFNNSLVGWQMRSIPGTIYGDLQNVVKYYHLFHKGDYLYNYDNAKKFKQVIVVEGVKKALKFPNSVATWGCCISKNQLKLIQTWPEVVMLLDSDKNNDNTQKMANKFVDNINLGGSSKAINIDLAKYDASSPDDLPKDILQEIVDNEWRINVH